MYTRFAPRVCTSEHENNNMYRPDFEAYILGLKNDTWCINLFILTQDIVRVMNKYALPPLSRYWGVFDMYNEYVRV